VARDRRLTGGQVRGLYRRLVAGHDATLESYRVRLGAAPSPSHQSGEPLFVDGWDLRSEGVPAEMNARYRVTADDVVVQVRAVVVEAEHHGARGLHAVCSVDVGADGDTSDVRIEFDELADWVTADELADWLRLLPPWIAPGAIAPDNLAGLGDAGVS